MTIDDLVKVYERHGIKVSVPDLIEVVRALRDESGRRGYLNWDDLDKILGSDAENEKVAGLDCNPVGARPQDAPPDPATDAAPAVCVWECGPVPDKKGLVRVTSKCAGFESVRSELVIGRASHNCPSCGKPITFKEANHG